MTPNLASSATPSKRPQFLDEFLSIEALPPDRLALIAVAATSSHFADDVLQRGP